MTHRIPLAAATLITVAGVLLVLDRSGLIAWALLIFGGALMLKTWLKPARLDLAFVIGLAVVAALAWVGTRYYVISTWESGEVVELEIETETGSHTVRLWVMDIGDAPVVYYDAPPEAAASLLAGRTLQFSRAGQTSARVPVARRVEDVPEDEASRILEAMGSKYAAQNNAADVYYLMLGRAGDRVALVVSLAEA